MCILFSSHKANVQVADAASSLMVSGALKKADPKEAAEGQSQQANSDVNKSTDLSLQKSQQSSTKSNVSSKQGSGPSNLSASQKSKVSGMTGTSESAQQSHHGSSGGTLGMCTKDVLVSCPNLAYCISCVYSFVTDYRQKVLNLLTQAL